MMGFAAPSKTLTHLLAKVDAKSPLATVNGLLVEIQKHMQKVQNEQDAKLDNLKEQRRQVQMVLQSALEEVTSQVALDATSNETVSSKNQISV